MQTFLDGRVELRAGDCLDVVRSLADNSIDSVVTDPPYALTATPGNYGNVKSNLEQPADKNLENINAGAFKRLAKGFMGKVWDTGDVAFSVEFWAEVLRVLKPGGHIAAFSGTRTYHRMACAIEDAGFEIRDQLAWCYGVGFPKSHDVSKGIDKADAARQWEGWGTALKPAWEPICLARKPLSEKTVAANVLRWGTGAINVDGCRVASELPEGRTRHGGGIAGNGSSYELPDSRGSMPSGRFPANLCHDGSEEVLAAFPDSNARPAKAILAGGVSGSGKKAQSAVYGAGREYLAKTGYDDAETSAARFFYSAKASRADRALSKHPTVKPVKLMQWLVRLITPPNGTTLDPFAGSGTTGEAAYREGFKAILIEREAEYQADIARRMELAKPEPSLMQTREEDTLPLPFECVA